jgi:hypothetical protein
VVTRRNNREAPDKGERSLLIANAPPADHLSPMVVLGLCTFDAASMAGRPRAATGVFRALWAHGRQRMMTIRGFAFGPEA